MKDSQGQLVLGRTKWKRFAAVVVPATFAMTALMGGIASGSTPVAINISGKTAMLSADKLVAHNFSQFPGVVTDANGKQIPVAASHIKSADIYNLCQSVKVGPVTLFIHGGQDPNKPVHADGLLIGMDYLAGDAVFDQINIGTDASTYNKIIQDTTGKSNIGTAGDFGQDAQTATITGLNQRFYSTYAGKFYLNGMSLTLKFDGSECFTNIKQ